MALLSLQDHMYIYSEFYNINLEKKLKSLSGKNYTSMKSVLFDHKSQIYVNDEEGLKLRSLLINLCENIGDDLGNLVDLSVYNK